METSDRDYPVDVDAGEALAGTCVMVVEDEPDTRELVCMLLRERGAIVVEWGNAEDALRGLEVMTPHMILSDLSLPGVDGWEMMRRVRARGIAIPALALSASAAPGDAARALDAGFTAHLAKPIGVGDLVDAVFAVRGQPQRDSSAATGAGTTSAKRKS